MVAVVSPVPCICNSILGAVPTYIELYRSNSKNVPFGESKKAALRNELWRKNMRCTALAPIDPLITDFNVEVDATICPSGDVLVRIFGPQNFQAFEWVSVDKFFAKDYASISIISEATASETNESNLIAQAYPFVICQRWLDQVMLIRRVQVGFACYDEVINTYTGLINRRTPAPCIC